MRDNTEKGTVHLESIVVMDEPQLLKLVHKEIDARSRGANHPCQGLLRHIEKGVLGFGHAAVSGK
jgi:hypothetical protein